jgi:cyclophilin family peptidyl-prolyl cis-trans isomerase
MMYLLLWCLLLYFQGLANNEDLQIIRDIGYQNLPSANLLPYLQDGNINQKREAIKTLGQMQSPATGNLFKTVIDANELELQEDLIEALSLNPYENDLKISLVKKELSTQHKSWLILSLGRYADESFVPFVINEFKEKTGLSFPETKIAAAHAIGFFAQRDIPLPKETSAFIIKCLNTHFNPLTRACGFALSQMPIDQQSKTEIWQQIIKCPDPETKLWLLKLTNGWVIPQDMLRKLQTETHPFVLTSLIQLGHLPAEQYVDSNNSHLQRAALQRIIETTDEPWPLVQQFVQTGSTVKAYQQFRLGEGKYYSIALEILDSLITHNKPWPADEFLKTNIPFEFQQMAMQTLTDKEQLVQYINEAIHTEIRTAAMEQFKNLDVSNKEMKTFLSHQDDNVRSIVIDWFNQNPSSIVEEVFWEMMISETNPTIKVKILNALTVLENSRRARLPSDDITENLSQWLSHPDSVLRRPAQKIANIRKLDYPEIFGDERWIIPISIHRVQNAVMQTKFGTIIIELFPEKAPLTVSTFVRLAEEGYYNDLYFHRVISGFVVQTGKKSLLDLPWYIPDELTMLPVVKGSVGLSLKTPNTGSSQFFINTTAQPQLQGSYPIFGQVIHGQWIVEKLQPWDRITSIDIERSQY